MRAAFLTLTVATSLTGAAAHAADPAPSSASPAEHRSQLPAGPVERSESIPLEAFFRNRPFTMAQLSPNGKHLAGFRDFADDRRIMVVEVATGQPVSVIKIGSDNRIDRFWWANDERILFSASFKGGTATRLGAVNVDGSGFRDFARRRNPKGDIPEAAFQQYGDQIVDLLPADRDGVLLQYIDFLSYRTYTARLYRLNVYNGRLTAVASAGRRVRAWYTDQGGLARVAYGRDHDGPFFIYRADKGSPWLELKPTSAVVSNEMSFYPLDASADPAKIYTAARVDSDRLAVHLYDIHTGQFSEPLLSNDRYDVEGPLYFSGGGAGRELIGISYLDHFHRTRWVEPTWKKWMEAAEGALPGQMTRLVGRATDDRLLLLYAISDRQPGTYYVYAPADAKLMRIASEHPDLDPARMAPVEAVDYRARDGRLIPAYLARPPGSAGRRVPVVVNPHGGPWARDNAAFDPELQFFASRGWAVFRPNFRGSDGYGLEHRMAGYGQWGLAMQDDISDGVAWLIEQGIADPDRICIYGGSYGGYAALMGLVKTPELYRCGAAFAAVSDIVDLIDDKEWYANFDDSEYAKLIGDRKADREKLRAASPAQRASDIRDPVFLAHGEEDRVVRVGQSRKMAEALKDAGKEHELLILEKEGHGLFYERNRLDFYRRLEAFLHRHLDGPAPAGGHAEAASAPDGGQAAPAQPH
jgi:dipeptidyl aminopeptidase/acylaminoacyl peptidase